MMPSEYAGGTWALESGLCSSTGVSDDALARPLPLSSSREALVSECRRRLLVSPGGAPWKGLLGELSGEWGGLPVPAHQGPPSGAAPGSANIHLYMNDAETGRSRSQSVSQPQKNAVACCL